jgi:hypothetical protein
MAHGVDGESLDWQAEGAEAVNEQRRLVEDVREPVLAGRIADEAACVSW